MAGSVVKVTFQVSVEKTNSGDTVFIVGDCPELGQWKPKLAKALRLVSQSAGLEIWNDTIAIEGASVVKYRFFIGSIDRSAVEEMVTVHKWESSPTPRSSALVGAELNVCSRFGQLDGCTYVNRGWLTGQVAVHLSLHDSSLKLNVPVDKDRRYFIKCLPIDTRMGNNNFASNETNFSGQVLNSDVETKVLVSNLNDDDATPYLMPSDGVVYDPNAFLTFHIGMWNAKYLGLKMIVSIENDDTNILRSQNLYQELGAAYINQDNIQCKDSFVASVVSKDCEIIGQLRVDILVITPLRYECDMSCCVDSFHKLDKKQAWFIGHRGMGRTLVNGVHNAAVTENTISSLNRAFGHGADLVEFDVMLSRDRIPILHHDFVTSISATCKLEGENSKVTIPVQNLNLKELETLKTVASTVITKTSLQDIQETETTDDQPFPTLQSCLEKVDPRVGFNVEIKYCMRLRSGELEEGLMYFPSRNEYVDDILTKLLHHSGSRRIILSSFDPDVCTMLRAKQNRYPVLFLTQGDTKKYAPYEDSRTSTVEMAFQFAISESLRGVCVHAESLLNDLSLIERGKSKGLWVVCWGDDTNSLENIKVLKKGGVDGIIVDRIHEFLCS